MKVTMMLADSAQAAEGKLYILGAGWTVTGPMPMPFAIAALIEVPWHLTNQRHTLRLECIDLHGNPVEVPTPNGVEPLAVEAAFEVGRPPGVRPGAAIPFPFVFNSGPVPLAPGGHYEWRLMIDGEHDADWRLAFSTRPAAQSHAA